MVITAYIIAIVVLTIIFNCNLDKVMGGKKK